MAKHEVYVFLALFVGVVDVVKDGLIGAEKIDHELHGFLELLWVLLTLTRMGCGSVGVGGAVSRVVNRKILCHVEDYF